MTSDASPSKRPPRARLSARKKLGFLGVVALFLFAVSEVVCFVAAGFLETKGVVSIPTPVEGYAAYLADRDPVLGWPAPSSHGLPPSGNRSTETDLVGARVSPAFPDREASPPAISFYGDSFTYSAEVGHDHAWPEVIARTIGRRVDNFGMGGYGSDQALLRFRSHVASGVDGAPVVVLAHLSENVLRNLNQYRSLLYGARAGGGFGFKPRFVLGAGGELEAVPIPEIPPGEMDRFIRRPGAYLAHETFLPGAPDGALRRSFPFTLTILRAFFHPRVVSEFRQEPAYQRFYDPAHPARGTELTARILASFHAEASALGRRPLVVLIPTGLDLSYVRGGGDWPYAPLADELGRLGVPFLDLGPPMAEAIGDEPLEAFFANGRISGHNSERGYELIAELVLERLRELGIDEAEPTADADAEDGA